jgi:hypothetical protein
MTGSFPATLPLHVMYFSASVNVFEDLKHPDSGMVSSFWCFISHCTTAGQKIIGSGVGSQHGTTMVFWTRIHRFLVSIATQVILMIKFYGPYSSNCKDREKRATITHLSNTLHISECKLALLLITLLFNFIW